MDRLKLLGIAPILVGIAALNAGSTKPADYEKRIPTMAIRRNIPNYATHEKQASQTAQDKGGTGLYLIQGDYIILCRYSISKDSVDFMNFPLHGFETSVKDPRAGKGYENIEVKVVEEETRNDCQEIFSMIKRGELKGNFALMQIKDEVSVSIPTPDYTLFFSDTDNDGNVDEVSVFFDEWLANELNSAYEKLKR